MYTASIHDHTISMDQLTGSHNYETVSVPATCGQNAYTEERCKDCGAIKAGSRVEEEGTAYEHHFVKFDETYYRTAEDSAVKHPKIGESLQNPNITWEKGTSYVCVRCLKATEEAPEVYDTHTYSPEKVEWTETDTPNDKKSYSGYTASISKLVCNEGCAERVGKLDAYMEDNALEVALDKEVKANAELTYEGTCADGATAVYTAVIETEKNGQFTVTKKIKLDPGVHQYDAAFEWVPIKNEAGVITGMESATAVLTCKVCGEVSKQTCELKSENIIGGQHKAGGIKYTASVTYNGHTYKDVNNESLVQYSVANAEVKTDGVEFVYNGKNQVPKINAVVLETEDSKNPQTLEEGTDYTIEAPEMSKNAGSYKLTIKGTGDKFIGEYTVEYKIAAKDISTANVALKSNSVTYTGSDVAPVVESVTLDNETLGQADYTVNATSVNVGEYKMTVEGQGNYTGKVELAYSIVAKDIEDATIDADTKLTYTGNTNTPVIKSVKVGENTLVENTDYVITEVPNSVSIGEYKMVIEGKGNYTGKVEFVYSIVAKDLQNATVDADTKLTYTGKTNTPVIKSVKVGEDTLVEGTDYVITEVPNSVNIGEYKMVIEGKGNYTGKVEFVYAIDGLETPVLSSVSNASTGVTVKWKAVEGANQYRVFYKTSGGKWKKAGDTTSTSYTVKKLTSGTKYTFTVRCLNGNGSYISSFDSKGKSITYIAAPTLSSVSNASTGVTIKWKAVKGANQYRVFYKTSGGKWKRAGDTKSTSYTVKKLTSGTNYTFTVRCLNGNGSYISSFDNKGKSIKYLAMPSVTTAKAKKGVTVKWSKIKGASGYYVYRKTARGSWKQIKKITSGSTVKYTDTTTKKGTTYYYTVRAYSGSTKSAYKTAGASAKAR
ncbi:hypothetical protein P261_01382 [Lachnospiraceae bacterium TWA4]|nr:hypothetical protein P261_01382 [Lachnospiraceae bacterium TWA4]